MPSTDEDLVFIICCSFEDTGPPGQSTEGLTPSGRAGRMFAVGIAGKVNNRFRAGRNRQAGKKEQNERYADIHGRYLLYQGFQNWTAGNEVF